MVESVAAATRSPARRGPQHIVDALIEERAPRLSKTWLWPLIRPPIYAILDYGRAVKMADAIGPMSGRAGFDHTLDLLKLNVVTRGLERVPRDGPFILLINHPTGIADGLALYSKLKEIRPDHLYYANSDALRVCPRFDELIIPVEWLAAKRTRERTRLTLKLTDEALAQGRPIVIFPAGRLARMRNGLLTDPEWMASAASIARRYELPVVPVHIAGPKAFWYHLFNTFSGELRNMTLFRELLNKTGQTYTLTFGPLIPAEHMAGEPTSTMRRVKHYVERVLPHAPDAPFDPNGPECQWRNPPDFGKG